MAMAHDLWQDTRFALRQLRRAPFFSFTVLLTLALSLGASAALAGVLRATLLNPLPYPKPGELMLVADENPKDAAKSGMMAVLRAADLADAQHGREKLFTGVGYFYSDEASLGVEGHDPTRVPAVGVSGGFFPTLATAPELGRTLGPADDVANGPQVLVISDALWRTRFAADPAVLGKAVRLGAAEATIVGVMPRKFNYPNGVDVWRPGHVTAASFAGYRGDGSRFVTVVGRLSAGVTEREALAQLHTLDERLARQFPATDAGWRFSMVSLRTSLFGRYRDALFLLSAAVALVLVLTASNLAGMQLSRNAQRAGEFAVRGALGIAPGRLLRQLMTESVLLVMAGGACGLALAYALLKVLRTRLPEAFLRVDVPHLDLAVVLLSLGLMLLVALLTAAVPAMEARAASASFATRVGSSLGHRRTRRFAPVFTAAQIAVALVLLTVAASVLANLYRLLRTPLGFDPVAVQTFSVDLPWGVDPAKAHRFYAQLEQQFAAMPGVEAAGYANAIPLRSTYTFRNTFDVVGRAPTPHRDTVIAEGRSLSPGYLHAMRIPVLAGRSLNAADEAAATPAAVMVNRALAQKYFPGGDAVGQHLRGAAGVNGKAYLPEIVGIAGDVQGTRGTLGAPVEPEVYFPANGGWPHMNFALRTALPASALEPEVGRMVRGLDATATVGKFALLSVGVARVLQQPRLNAGLLTGFAVVSLLLVVIGVYGLVAFDVAQRTRELGLRLALGASRGGVLRLVLSRSVRMLAAGLAAGVLGSFLAHRVLLRFEAATPALSGSFSVALVTAALCVLAAAVLAATWVPARRASNLDPIVALRAE